MELILDLYHILFLTLRGLKQAFNLIEWFTSLTKDRHPAKTSGLILRLKMHFSLSLIPTHRTETTTMQLEPSQKVSAEKLSTVINPITQEWPFPALLHRGCLAAYPHGIL